MTYESAASKYQINVLNSNFSGMYSPGHSPTFKIASNKTWLYVYNSIFTNITAGYQ